MLRRIITCWLRGRHNIDAIFFKPTDRHLHLGTVTIKAREGMNTNNIENPVRTCRLLQHFLEDRAFVVSGRCTRLNKLGHHFPPLRLTITGGGIALRWQGNIIFGLASGANAQIKSYPLNRVLRQRASGREGHNRKSPSGNLSYSEMSLMQQQ